MAANDVERSRSGRNSASGDPFTLVARLTENPRQEEEGAERERSDRGVGERAFVVDHTRYEEHPIPPSSLPIHTNTSNTLNLKTSGVDLRHQGPTAAATILSDVLDGLAVAQHDRLYGSFRITDDRVFGSDAAHLSKEQQITQQQLREDIILNLISFYKTHIAPINPIIPPHRVMAVIDATPQILPSILAVAALSRQVPFAVYSSIRSRLARQLAENVASVSTLLHIQIMLISGMSHEIHGDTNMEGGSSCWLRVGSAIRQAQDIGLHRLDERHWSAEAYADRARIWIGCVIMDRWYAGAFGLPFSIHLGDCEDPSANQSLLQTPDDSHGFQAQLYQLSAGNRQALQQCTDRELVNLQTDIDNFVDSVPEEFSFVGMTTSTQGGILALTIACTETIFYRPFVKLNRNLPQHITFQPTPTRWFQVVMRSRLAISWMSKHGDVPLDCWLLVKYAMTYAALSQYYHYTAERDTESLASLRLAKEVMNRWALGHNQAEPIATRAKIADIVNVIYQAAVDLPSGKTQTSFTRTPEQNTFTQGTTSIDDMRSSGGISTTPGYVQGEGRSEIAQHPQQQTRQHQELRQQPDQDVSLSQSPGLQERSTPPLDASDDIVVDSEQEDIGAFRNTIPFPPLQQPTARSRRHVNVRSRPKVASLPASTPKSPTSPLAARTHRGTISISGTPPNRPRRSSRRPPPPPPRPINEGALAIPRRHSPPSTATRDRFDQEGQSPRRRRIESYNPPNSPRQSLPDRPSSAPLFAPPLSPSRPRILVSATSQVHNDDFPSLAQLPRSTNPPNFIPDSIPASSPPLDPAEVPSKSKLDQITILEERVRGLRYELDRLRGSELYHLQTEQGWVDKGNANLEKVLKMQEEAKIEQDRLSAERVNLYMERSKVDADREKTNERLGQIGKLDDLFTTRVNALVKEGENKVADLQGELGKAKSTAQHYETMRLIRENELEKLKLELKNARVQTTAAVSESAGLRQRVEQLEKGISKLEIVDGTFTGQAATAINRQVRSNFLDNLLSYLPDLSTRSATRDMLRPHVRELMEEEATGERISKSGWWTNALDRYEQGGATQRKMEGIAGSPWFAKALAGNTTWEQVWLGAMQKNAQDHQFVTSVATSQTFLVELAQALAGTRSAKPPIEIILDKLLSSSSLSTAISQQLLQPSTVDLVLDSGEFANGLMSFARGTFLRRVIVEVVTAFDSVKSLLEVVEMKDGVVKVAQQDEVMRSEAFKGGIIDGFGDDAVKRSLEERVKASVDDHFATEDGRRMLASFITSETTADAIVKSPTFKQLIIDIIAESSISPHTAAPTFAPRSRVPTDDISAEIPHTDTINTQDRSPTPDPYPSLPIRAGPPIPPTTPSPPPPSFDLYAPHDNPAAFSAYETQDTQDTIAGSTQPENSVTEPPAPFPSFHAWTLGMHRGQYLRYLDNAPSLFPGPEQTAVLSERYRLTWAVEEIASEYRDTVDLHLAGFKEGVNASAQRYGIDSLRTALTKHLMGISRVKDRVGGKVGTWMFLLHELASLPEDVDPGLLRGLLQLEAARRKAVMEDRNKELFNVKVEASQSGTSRPRRSSGRG
nr:uncharacterized protein CI109_006673 [Kwoniella shandongensis]KAA5525033.1 hypothetical protein CI109_006673 [Kwoniella shandongensis]